MDLQEPKLPEFYSPGRTFLSAFAMGAAISARRQQLEQNLQEMDLKRIEADQQRIQQQKNYDLNVKQLAETTRYHNIEADDAAARLKEAISVRTAKSTQDQQDSARMTEFASKAYTLPSQAKLGTETFDPAFNVLKSQYADLADSAGFKRITTDLESRHKAAAATSVQAGVGLQRSYKAALETVGTNFGLPADVVNNYFQNPDIWNLTSKKAYVNYDSKGQPIRTDDPEASKKYKGAYTLERSRYDAIKQLGDAALPAPGNRPDLSATTQPSGSRQQAIDTIKAAGYPPTEANIQAYMSRQ